MGFVSDDSHELRRMIQALTSAATAAHSAGRR